MKHGWANVPERWLSTRSFRLKKDAYMEIMRFWDTIVSGEQIEEREVVGQVSSKGYEGIGKV